MLLEELFQEGFSDLNLFKGDMADRKFKEPEPPKSSYSDLHKDDPARQAWHDAGGNPPGYGPENTADNLAILKVGKAWHSMTDEQKDQWHKDNPSEDPSRPPPPTLAQRQAETARQNAMTDDEKEADKKRKRAEHWAKLKKAREEADAKIEAEKKKKAEAEKKKKAEADKNLAAAHGN
jgi:hypothetical protein